jgi:hypothetical protein
MGGRAVGVRRHPVLVIAGLTAAAAAAFVLWWFQPQKLFLDKTVDEALPAAVGAAAGSAAPVVVAAGPLRSGEHHTEGTARLLRLSDGAQVLRLEDLRTSNGPVVKVWLTSADADASNDVIADARHLDLGGLEGNLGNQNYPVPSGAESARFNAVVIWCARFHVAFGSAALTPLEN